MTIDRFKRIKAVIFRIVTASVVPITYAELEDAVGSHPMFKQAFDALYEEMRIDLDDTGDEVLVTLGLYALG